MGATRIFNLIFFAVVLVAAIELKFKLSITVLELQTADRRMDG